MISTKVSGLIIRETTVDDVPLILEFIKGLAEYEKLLHEVDATEESLKSSLFDLKVAEAVIAEYEGKPAGFSVFFHNFSTFRGRPGMYLEDLFVKPEFRKMGIGKALLTYVGKVAKERGCARYEWTVLDWNEPSILFYRSIGAEFLEDWSVMRVDGRNLDYLAKQF